MGQSKWGWACALIVGANAVHAAPPDAGNPFGAESPNPHSAEQRIEAALDQPLKSQLDAPGLSLRDVMNQLATDYEIPILFDDGALDAVGMSPDAEVTINVNHVTLRSALELILRKVELVYLVRDDVLFITTADEADRILEIVIYRVDDLQAARLAKSDSDLQPEPLGKMICRLIDRSSWSANKTGEGEIAEWPGMLIVANTHPVHRKIEALLKSMRSTRDDIASGEAVNRESVLAAGTNAAPRERGGF